MNINDSTIKLTEEQFYDRIGKFHDIEDVILLMVNKEDNNIISPLDQESESFALTLSNDESNDGEEITIVLKPSQLIANPLQTSLSEWVRFFMSKVGGYCAGVPKFFELRPKHFYLS